MVDLILRLSSPRETRPSPAWKQVLRMPFKMLDEMLLQLQAEHLVEVPGATGRMGRRAYVYRITDEGKTRARDAARTHPVHWAAAGTAEQIQQGDHVAGADTPL